MTAKSGKFTFEGINAAAAAENYKLMIERGEALNTSAEEVAHEVAMKFDVRVSFDDYVSYTYGYFKGEGALEAAEGFDAALAEELENEKTRLKNFIIGEEQYECNRNLAEAIALNEFRWQG